MADTMTREEGAGMRWPDKFHKFGRSSNFMNDMTYQPASPPDQDTLATPLPPMYRAELVEALQEGGIPEPDRRLTWDDFYRHLRRRPADPYEGSPYKAEWEGANPGLVRQLAKAWLTFLAALPPSPFEGQGWENIPMTLEQKVDAIAQKVLFG